MDSGQLDQLKQILTRAKKGDAAALGNPQAVMLVDALVTGHEQTIRAETFWGDRAPALNNEVLALRPLEVFARLIANGGELSEARLGDLQAVLKGLDEARAGKRP